MSRKWLSSTTPFFLGIGLSSHLSFQVLIPSADAASVLTTTTLAADLVQNCVRSETRIQVLMPAGSDPHLFRAIPEDLKKIQEAELIIAHGHHLEGPLFEALVRIKKQRPDKVVFLGELIEPSSYIVSEGVVDPHLWMDPTLWAQSARGLEESLKTRGLLNETSCRSFQAQLEELSRELVGRFKKIPAQRRVLVTPHMSFAYFSKRVGLETWSVLGSSTENQLSLGVLEKLQRRIQERQIKAVFFESAIHPGFMQKLADRVGVKLVGPLYSDTLGAQAPLNTYIGMQRHNADLVVQGLLER